MSQSNDDVSSSWNVVVAKRQPSAPSAKPAPARPKKAQGLHSSQQKSSSQKPRQPKQPPQQQAKNKSNPNNKNNTNNPKSQKNTTNAAVKTKSKPKPQTVTVGHMLPGAKKKATNKNENKGGNPQQQQKQALHSKQNQPRRQPPNLHMDSIQDFPALGGSSSTSAPAVPVAIPKNLSQRKGWGDVPRPPPPPAMALQSQGTPKHKSIPHTTTPQKIASAQSSGPQPQRILKRGEQAPIGNTQQQLLQPAGATSKKKKPLHAKKESSSSTNHPCAPSAASFFQPRLRESTNDKSHNNNSTFPVGSPSSRGMEGEEHQLLRLMQERTVYQKKGRQRVAPRKKKFTALKKKVLQERLAQWRALNPEEASTSEIKEGLTPSLPTCSLCIYNFAVPEELEDDDEYEEIIDNLKGMATKIGPIDEVFIPRNSVFEEEAAEEDSSHPSFVQFQKESDASAALACWNGLVIGGTSLEVFGLDVSPPRTPQDSDWCRRVVTAELKRCKADKGSAGAEEASSINISIRKVLMEDDFEDEDCMSESIGDLQNIASQFGEVREIQADPSQNGDVLITYRATLNEARSIAEKISRVVVGGQPLYASVCEPQAISSAVQTAINGVGATIVLLENVLTADDLEDDDCLQESLNDIRELCNKYGSVSDVVANGSAVKVMYEEEIDVVEKAASDMNGVVLGGNVVRASVLHEQDDGLENSVDMCNLLTADDIEDEDCMEESLSDVRKLATAYGIVKDVSVVNSEGGSDAAFVRIRFASKEEASKAVGGLGDMVIGGQIVAVSLSSNVSRSGDESMTEGVAQNPGDKRKTDISTSNASSEKKARTDDKEPLYSGDKLISDRFAEMKRAPKVPSKGPREYATSRAVQDERVKPLLSEMLGELMRLQKRAMEDKNAKARRRMVMGLREVARGIRAHKVKMVVMANNLDQYGVIDDKLQEIIDLANSEGVPLFFEFTKRSLGKAIGKSIKIAVVGIQNADGAHQPFKKLNAIASRM